MDNDYLTSCVVDPSKRTVRIYSSEGEEREIKCDTTEEFMNVLNFVRDKVEEERVFYSDPL